MSYEPPSIEEITTLATEDQTPFGLLCAINSTERDDALLFSRLQAGKWLFVYDEKRWVKHSNGVWLDANHEIIAAFQSTLFEEYYKYTSDGKNSLPVQSSIKRISKTKSVQASLQVCSNLLAIHSTAFDSKPLEFNLLNGVYDFRTQTFRPHNDSDRFRVQVPYNYDPSADAPFFREFLETIFLQDYDLIRWLLQRIAVCMTADCPYEEIYLLYGEGANGKSMFLNVLQMIAGDYSITINGELFIQKKDDSSDERTLARLQGKRLAVASELPPNRQINESKLKALSGNDKVTARRLYSEQTEYIPSAHFILATNEKPRISSMGEAIWRRVRLIPFLHTIPQSQRKPKSEMVHRFEAEISGIFNLIVEQYRENPALPPSVVQATEEYKTENDQLSDFLGECCIIESEALSKLKDLYKKYSDWLSTNGARANYHTDKKFLTALLTVPGVEKEVIRKNVVLRGIRIEETLL